MAGTQAAASRSSSNSVSSSFGASSSASVCIQLGGFEVSSSASTSCAFNQSIFSASTTSSTDDSSRLALPAQLGKERSKTSSSFSAPMPIRGAGLIAGSMPRRIEVSVVGFIDGKLRCDMSSSRSATSGASGIPEEGLSASLRSSPASVTSSSGSRGSSAVFSDGRSSTTSAIGASSVAVRMTLSTSASMLSDTSSSASTLAQVPKNGSTENKASSGAATKLIGLKPY